MGDSGFPICKEFPIYKDLETAVGCYGRLPSLSQLHCCSSPPSLRLSSPSSFRSIILYSVLSNPLNVQKGEDGKLDRSAIGLRNLPSLILCSPLHFSPHRSFSKESIDAPGNPQKDSRLKAGKWPYREFTGQLAAVTGMLVLSAGSEHAESCPVPRSTARAQAPALHVRNCRKKG